MYEIADLILEYKTTTSNHSLQKILDMLTPFIRAKANKVHPFYREDVIQELRLGTVTVIHHLNILTPALDDNLFHQNINYLFLTQKNFSAESIQTIFPYPYFVSFLKETGVQILRDAFLTQNTVPIQNLFLKFNLRNQFFHILEKKYTSVLCSFYRKFSSSIALESRSLNMKNDRGVEYIEEVKSSYSSFKINLEKYGIQKEDAEFIMLFLDGTKILTQEKVSKLLGTTQQNISKKVITLRKKYQGKLLN